MKTFTNQNLIFLHLPKNGGNTLHGILDRMYPKENTFNIKVVDNTKLNIPEFKALSQKERTSIKLLKGHMNFGLHNYLIGNTKYITFLRKPEERIISFYHYAKSRPQHRLYKSITEQNWSLKDFVTHCDEGDVHNAQIRWISGLKDVNEKQMLEKAKLNIDKHFSFVGFQEHFDTSLLILSNLYGWGIPFYVYLNKGKHGKSSKLLDSETIKIIAEKNKGDMELYDYMVQRFLKQQKNVKALSFKLHRLRYINKLYSKPFGKKLLTRLNIT